MNVGKGGTVILTLDRTQSHTVTAKTAEVKKRRKAMKRFQGDSD